uniref:THAP domain-containing protein 1 n=1 Tax=Fundulus heteroclitus TaxID=8078 RepID=A0A3Q2QQM8_FUNHE
MVKVCVAYGCSNTNKNNVSLHTFPNPKRPGGEKILAEWNRQVRRTRANWVGPWKSHGTYAWNSCVICSDHFTADCFQVKNSVAMEIGFKTKALLKPDAVPTIFKRPSGTGRPHQSDSSSTRRHGGARKKPTVCTLRQAPSRRAQIHPAGAQVGLRRQKRFNLAGERSYWELTAPKISWFCLLMCGLDV